ncbi:MAG: PDZ domain-containing protein [Ignavibacteria bacterium]|nr:PDZ domain-containing protein [Ignavibacteria bacterium]
MKHIIMAALVLCLGAGAALPLSAQESKEKAEKKALRVTASTKGPWLGVMLKEMKEVTVGSKGKKSTGTKGAMVSEVVDDSPAEKAGIEDGDIITEFDGRKIADASALVDAVQKAGVGKSVAITVLRGDEKKTVTAELEKAPKSSAPQAFSFSTPRPPHPPLAPMAPGFPMPARTKIMRTLTSGASSHSGMKLMQLDGQLAEYFGAPNNKGVLVENVRKDSPADKAGFKAGDVVVRAGKKTIEDAGDVRAAFGAYDKGEKIPFEVIRKGARSTLDMEVTEDDDDDGDEDHMMFFGNPGRMRIQRFGDDGPDDVDINVELEGLQGELEGLHDQLREMEITVEDENGEKGQDGPKIERRVKIKMKKDGKDI